MDLITKPIIVSIGIEESKLNEIASYLGHKYQFVHINHKFNIDGLSSYANVALFLVNTDLIWTEIVNLVLELKHTPKYQNTPYIGFALKRHIETMPKTTRLLFEDIILMPCSNEDLLTRIDIWIRTNEFVNNSEDKAVVFEVDPNNLK